MRILICVLLCCLRNVFSQLDYKLYSLLSHELSLDSPSSIVNYFNLNKETLTEYNEYLHFSAEERVKMKTYTKSMFEFAYDNYMLYAYPMDELDPIHCRGRGPDLLNPGNINVNDALGDYLLTLVESMSTLAVLGNSTEFKRAVKLVVKHLNFDKNNTVQVFESTIRILGGLLSAHLIITDKNQPFGEMTIDNYDNELLTLAHDLSVRLLTAFNNPSTNLPHPRVNLRYGIPRDSFNHTCTSGAGTLLLEFGVLSSLLDDPIYESVARKAVKAIFDKRDPVTGLISNELNIHTGSWQSVLSGLGAGIDSFFEYLLKGFVLFGKNDDFDMYNKTTESIKNFLRRGRAECFHGDGHHPIFVNVHMNNGNILNYWIDALQASHPGVQVLEGDLQEAICFHALFFAIWKKFKVLPERFNWNLKLPDVYFYPLRPEFAESTYFLYRATRNPFYLHVAKLIAENLYEITKVK